MMNPSHKAMLEALPAMVQILADLSPGQRVVVVDAAQEIVRAADYKSMSEPDALAAVMSDSMLERY